MNNICIQLTQVVDNQNAHLRGFETRTTQLVNYFEARLAEDKKERDARLAEDKKERAEDKKERDARQAVWEQTSQSQTAILQNLMDRLK